MPMEISMNRAGFAIIFVPSQGKYARRRMDRQHMRARISSLASIPQRYPRMPKEGMAKRTNARRIIMAVTFRKKVTEVFPSPFKMLPMVDARYMKGHSQERAAMKKPAFWS